MKTVTITLLFYFGCIHAQQGGWEKFYNNNGAVRAHDIKPTSDGGYIMTGFSNPTGTFFGHDVMLMKINSEGDFEWSMNFDAADGSDQGYEVIETFSGGFALVGLASTPSSFGGGGVFILTDFQGNLIKQDFYGGEIDGDRLHGIKQTPLDSGFVLVGVSGNPPFLVRTDKHGDTLFTKRYDDLVGVFQAVACSEDGEFLYLAGYTGVQNKSIMMKVNLNGEVIWHESYIDVGAEELYALTMHGDYVVASGRATKADPTEPAEFHTRVINTENGQTVSLNHYGNSNSSVFNSIDVTHDNGLIMVGTRHLGSLGSKVYVVKSDFQGELIWEHEFGQSPVLSSGRGICKGHDYGYMVCGHTNINGSAHVYVIKIDENGSVVSTNSFPFLPEISLYPNPCSEVLHIQLGTFESEKRITVFNNAGQEVYNLTTLDNEMQINEVGFWSTGVYLVHVEVEGHKVVRKVVVE